MVNAIFPRYIQVPAGEKHTVLLRSDGHAVASGLESLGRCQIPPSGGGNDPPRPGEVLMARFGWVISGSVADMDRIHAWLLFVQRRIWYLRHGSECYVGPNTRLLICHVYFWDCLVVPPFGLGLITGGSLVLCSGFLSPGPCGLGDGTDLFSACRRVLLVWG